MERRILEAKLALCAIKAHADSHIQVDQAACARCRGRPCLRACPAQLYTLEQDSGEILIEHAGCLECGTCLIICPEGSVTWHYPTPGHGIRYRHG